MTTDRSIPIPSIQVRAKESMADALLAIYRAQILAESAGAPFEGPTVTLLNQATFALDDKRQQLAKLIN